MMTGVLLVRFFFRLPLEDLDPLREAFERLRALERRLYFDDRRLTLRRGVARTKSGPLRV